MITIYDIARRASVSVATVSRVLNNDPSVLPENRRLVLQAIEELGYVPNATARSLSNCRSHTIGLVVPDLSNAIAQQTVDGVTKVVSDRGYSLLLCDSRRDERIQAENLRRLFERRVEGLIFSPLGQSCLELDLFLRAKVPTLVVSSHELSADVPRIYLKRSTGVRMGIKYLSGLGHRRIALVGPGTPPYSPLDEGYCQTLHDLGLPCDSSLLAESASPEECAGALESMLGRPDRPTAVICGAHGFAPFLLMAIHAAGLSLPEDLSFLTIGDSPWTRAQQPPLSVLAYDHTSLGAKAAEYLFTHVMHQLVGGPPSEVGFELIVRGSCAPARTTG